MREVQQSWRVLIGQESHLIQKWSRLLEGRKERTGKSGEGRRRIMWSGVLSRNGRRRKPCRAAMGLVEAREQGEEEMILLR